MENRFCCINPLNQNLCERLIEERNDLQSKIESLKEFMKTDVYRSLEYARRDLLSRQLYSMLQYACILECRINDFILNA